MRGLYAAFALVATFAMYSKVWPQDPLKPVQLAKEENNKLYRSFLPQTSDNVLKALLEKDLMFYTEREMPSAFQHNGGVFASANNFSAAARPGSYAVKYFGGQEPYGNPNKEFPWGSPAGTQDSPNHKSIRFAYFPKPIVYWETVLKGDDTRNADGTSYTNICWQYGEGTVFGELLLVTDLDGYDWTFELRTRTKTAKGWAANVYRPYTTPKDLIKAIENIQKWRDDPKLKDLHNHLKNPTKMRLVTVKNQHPVSIFDSKAPVDNLPAIARQHVLALLNTEFKSALGQEWRSQDGVEAHAPSTEAKFHIVPANYRGSHVAVNSRSCMNCHNTVQQHADDYHRWLQEPLSVQFSQYSSGYSGYIPRDWYGRVRGSDGIFSFHPFALESINRTQGALRYERKLRPDFLKSGLLVRSRR